MSHWISFIAASLLSAAALSAAAPAVAADLPFATTAVELRKVSREQLLDGIVEAINRSTVSAQTSGRVREILFDVDDYVTKGAVLVRFSDTEQRAALAQAEANFNEAGARHKEALAEYQRNKEVFGKNLVSRSAMDKAEAALKSAEARLEAAKAGVESARQQVEYTEVKAPYSGIVVERHVELGELANPGTPLMTGVSLENLRVTAHVPQSLIEAVRENGKARVIVRNGEERTIAATKLTFFPHSDPQTHTFTVRVDLPEGQQGLYPGMFVKVAFVIGEEVRLLLPASAVARRSEVSGAYVVAADGTVQLRQVRVGQPDDAGMVEALAGLDAGERIALDPLQAGLYLKKRLAGEKP